MLSHGQRDSAAVLAAHLGANRHGGAGRRRADHRGRASPGRARDRRHRRIFVATGNGTAPAPAPGNRPPQDLGDSVVQLGVRPNGTLHAVDFFSPANAPYLGANDIDVGSGGPVGLPFGSTTYPHLLVQSGKDGRVFLLDRDSLGGREQGPNGTDDVVSVSGPYAPRGQWGHPAVFGNTATLTRSNHRRSSPRTGTRCRVRWCGKSRSTGSWTHTPRSRQPAAPARRRAT